MWIEATERAAQVRQARLQAELDRWLPILRDMGVRQAIVFGSFARGEVGPASDLDLLVVHDDRRRFLDRLDTFYRRLEPHVALDLLVYTPEEVERLRLTSPTVRSALDEGQVVYEAAGTR